MKKQVFLSLLVAMILTVPHWLYAADESSHPTFRAALLIVNPVSGNKHGQAIADRSIRQLQEAGFTVAAIKTEYRGHAKSIIQEDPLFEFDMIIVVGGDGTLNEVVNGSFSKPDRKNLPIAIIPSGTGNGYAQALGIKGIEDALQVIIEGKTKPVDSALIEYMNQEGEEKQTSMITFAGLGIGVAANRTAESMRFLGPIRYNLGIIWQLFLNPFYFAKITCDDEQPKIVNFTLLAALGTEHSGDGLRLAPNAELDDGQMELLYAPHMGRLQAVHLFWMIMNNGNHIENPTVTFRKFQKVLIEPCDGQEQLDINIDGEDQGKTPCSITVRPLSFTVFSKK